ncbi:MAG: histone deacetylase, partial [Bacteroidota bacterium]
DHAHALAMHTAGEAYLRLLRETLPGALVEAAPDLVVYNAGTDVYRDDPLGGLALSADDILARDTFVVDQVQAQGAALLWVPSGGYTHDSAALVATSLLTCFGSQLT